ncbi:MAG: tetratricopeptide repeat protein [Sodalis sp. (in: enterobacteria)]|uniref:tetratricopeptide repeat protein n=1 Tax=Sodalis sp. (in: enterobacteria) TaxID=1898979 RepID=UPI0039E3CB8C
MTADNYIQKKNIAETLWKVVNSSAGERAMRELPEGWLTDLAGADDNDDLHQQLENAAAFFRFLCIYDCHNPDYYIGLGAVYQLQKQYQKAADIYAVAFSMAKQDYRPVFYSGQCQALMQKKAKAKRYFQLIIDHCQQNELTRWARQSLDELSQPAEGQEKHNAGLDDCP